MDIDEFNEIKKQYNVSDKLKLEQLASREKIPSTYPGFYIYHKKTKGGEKGDERRKRYK